MSPLSTTSKPGSAALLRRVSRALLRLEREQICCGEVTRQQFDTLRALDEAGGLTTSAVARRLGIDLSTASRNLAVLERQGCVRRRDGAEDARHTLNLVTAKGRACVESLCCDESSAVDAVLARLPRAEQAAVMRALGLLAGALEAACGGDCCPPAAPSAPSAPPATAPARRSTRPETSP